jgi:carbon monoxide dehydrogenase subunit G
MKLENSFTVPVPRADAWKVLMDVERIAPCMPGATLTSRTGDEFTGTVKVKVGPINLTYGGQARFLSLDEDGGVAVIEGSGKETRGTGTAKALITCRLVETGGSTKVDVETDLAVTGKPAQFGRGVLADVSAKLVDRFAACLSEEISAGEPTEEVAAAPAPAAADPALASAAADTPAAEDTSVPGAGPAFSIGEGAGPAEAAASGNGATPSAAVPTSSTSTATAPTAPAQPTPLRRPVREAEAIDLLDTAGVPVLKRAAPAVGALLLLLWVVSRLRRR